MLTLKDTSKLMIVCVCVNECVPTSPFILSPGVLDEGSDILVNVNMIDDERAAKNVELRKGKPDYNPYEEEEVDEYGNVSPRTIICHLSELIGLRSLFVG